MRKLPAVLVIAVLVTPLALHVTEAPVAAPVSSTRANPLPVAPLALFQLDLGTTPATSEAAMGVEVDEASLMLMAPERVTTRVVVAECVRLPLVPVMVSVDVPTDVVLAV